MNERTTNIQNAIRIQNQPWSTSTYTLYIHALHIKYIYIVSYVYSQVIWSGLRPAGVHHLQKPVNPNLCWVVLCCKNGFMGICQCKHHCRCKSHRVQAKDDGVTFSRRTEVVGCIVVDRLNTLLYNLLTPFAWTNPQQPNLLTHIETMKPLFFADFFFIYMFARLIPWDPNLWLYNAVSQVLFSGIGHKLSFSFSLILFFFFFF